jgi:hypothetical protein
LDHNVTKLDEAHFIHFVLKLDQESVELFDASVVEHVLDPLVIVLVLKEALQLLYWEFDEGVDVILFIKAVVRTHISFLFVPILCIQSINILISGRFVTILVNMKVPFRDLLIDLKDIPDVGLNIFVLGRVVFNPVTPIVKSETPRAKVVPKEQGLCVGEGIQEESLVIQPIC